MAINRRENPYTCILYEAMREEGWDTLEFDFLKALLIRTDVLHVHWLETYSGVRGSVQARINSLALMAVLHVARARGTTIVWTMHNAKAHDGRRPELERRLQEFMLARADRVITLSEAARSEGQRRFPGASAKFEVAPHPHYADYYPPAVDRREARDRLGLPQEAFVFLYLGQIRRYKGLEILLEAFKAANVDGRHVLLIAGNPSPAEYETAIRAALDGDPCICFEGGFIPDDRLGLYAGAADVGVLPYLDILNSGSALLLGSFGLPIVTPRLGALTEFVTELGEGILYDPADPVAALASALEAAVRRYGGREGTRERLLARLREAYDPRRIARRHIAIYDGEEALAGDCVTGPRR